MPPTPPSQTFVGAIVVAVLGTVLGGLILLFIQNRSFGPDERGLDYSAPGRSVPGRPSPNLPLPDHPVPARNDNSVRTFVAPIGVTKIQITQCVQRNSSQFILGRDYTLDVDKGAFGEVFIKLYERDDTLEDILRACSKVQAN